MNTQLKILHVSSPLTWRGGEQQLSYLHNGLLDLGIDSVVFCPGNSVLFKRLKPDHRIGYRKRSGVDLLAANALKNICKKREIQVIHAHDSHAHTTAVLASILGNDIPIVLSRRVDFPIKKKWFTRFKYNHQSVRSILSVSKAIQDIIRPAITAKHIVLNVVHSSCDTKRFTGVEPLDLRQELGLDEGTRIVGNVAALADHKDHHTFLKTAQAVLEVQDNVVFMIVGSGELEAELRTKSMELGIQERVKFLGFRQDLPRIYPNLDVFLFTSKTEGLGTSVLDAFANRIPVVSTDAGGIPEMVVHERTGLMASVGDHHLLAEYVVEILSDAKKSRKLTENASEKLKEFSVDQMVAKTLEVYRKI